MTTLKEVAARAGASINTVSRVLNNKLNESWPKVAARAEEIRRIASEMGYRPNSAARAMRNRQSPHIGVLVSGSYASPYEFPIVDGIASVLQPEGYSLTIINASTLDANRPQEALAFKEAFLEAIFLMHVERGLSRFAEKAVPRHIWLDSEVRGPNRCVYRDEVKSGRIVVRKLHELGYRRMLYLGYILENGHPHAIERLAGARQEAQELGVELEVIESGFQPQERDEAGRRLSASFARDVGIVAASENLAQWCANIAGRKGLYPGRDFAVAACADTHEFSSIWPWLSRVAFNRIDLGRRAGELMLKLLKTGKEVKSLCWCDNWIPGKTAVRL